MAVAVDSGPGCGHHGHGDDCLCDVVIGAPAAITIEQLDDLPFVRGTVERLGVGVPWTSGDLESVMRIVLQAHDMRARRVEARLRVRVHRPLNEERQRILTLHSSGHSLTAVLAELDCTFEDWRQAFLPSARNPLHNLSYDDWLFIEQAISTGTATVVEIARRYGIARKTMIDALHWLGLADAIKQRARDQGGSHRLHTAEREQVKAWIRADLSPSEIKRLVWENFEIDIDRSLVSHMRLRMERKGDL